MTRYRNKRCHVDRPFRYACVYDIIYYIIIEDLPTSTFNCVTNSDTSIVSTYNQISTVLKKDVVVNIKGRFPVTAFLAQ